MTPWLSARDEGIELAVRVQPRASVTEVQGPLGDALKIRLAAPPVDGAANRELVAFLAKRLGVPKSAVRIAAGERGRRKRIVVDGTDVREAATALVGKS
ncbi:MAG: DUF167 domain-containing protein [Gemmatimonadota bacterium]|nr:DUF167 domain-containing protein [Gemmatimonadota bacterium]